MHPKKFYFPLLFFCVNTFLFAQTYTYTFTPCGATGRYGPTATMVTSSYSNTSLNGQVTTTNGIQSWTVPASGIYRIEANGAKGGGGFMLNTGAGAKAQGDFTLSAGQILKICVGQLGGNGLYTQGGGGGGSFVTDNTNTPLIIAGGGGGASEMLSYSAGSASMSGTSGTSGMPGSNGSASVIASSGGTSGSGGGVCTTYTAGQGSGGGGLIGNGTDGNPSTGGLSFINGATGGAGASSSSGTGGDGSFGGGGGADWSLHTGAGGGGGYSGGGGGTYYGFGGGGGSYNAGQNAVNTSSANPGDGYVIVTNISGVRIIQSASITCHGMSNAALTASVFGGTAPFTYSWSPSVSSSSLVSGLGPGTYTCRATDAASVVYTNTFTIVQPPALTLTPTQTNVICYGQSNGVAKVNVSGGQSPYSYSWSPGVSSTSLASGLGIGSYTCFIQDALTCSNNVTFAISQPTLLTVFGVATNPTVCSGQSSILLGGGALTYTWSNNVTNAVAFTPTVTTTYTLTGMDAAGCTATALTSIIVNATPTLSIAGTSTLCSGNSLNLAASGANSYSWNTGATTASISLSPTLSSVYSVIGTASNGCQAVATRSVTVFNLTVVNANASGLSVCNGNTLNLYGSGANTYTWTGGVTNNVPFVPVSNSGYTVTGMGICGTASAAISITVNPLPLVSASSSNSQVCTGSSVTLSGNGASSYSWSNGISNNIPFILSASRSYTVTGTDANGCSNTATLSVTALPLPIVTASVSSTVICQGSSVVFSGGGASTYTWTGGVTNNVNFTPLNSSSYSVTGTDLNGCMKTATTSVNVIVAPTVSANASSMAVCAGNTLNLFGGGALSYTWSGVVNNNVPFVPTSTNTYTVYGSNACFTASNVITVTVNALPVVSASASSTVICQGSTLTLSGQGASSYTWSGGISNNVPFSPASSGIYTVTGTDANGCKNTAIKSITVNTLPIVTATASNYTLCQGQSLSLSGSGAQTYTWTGNVTNGVPFFPSSSQSYTVTGTNINNCVNSASLSITVNATPVVTLSASSLSVCSGNSVALMANGANQYTISGNHAPGVPFSPSISATYSAIGMNTLTGCTSTITSTVSVLVYSLPVVSASASSSVVCSGSSVTLNGMGANSYSWNNNVSDGIPFDPTSSTSYTVTGTSSLTGCSATHTIGISVNPIPTLGIVASHTAVCAGQSLTLSATGADTYSWTNGVLNQTGFIPVSSSVYTVTGTYTLSGCSASASQSIVVNSLPVLVINESSTQVCAGQTLIINAQGANIYNFSGGISSGVAFVPTVSTNYSVSGTNTLTGCNSTVSVVPVVVNALPTFSFNSTSPKLCTGETATIIVSGATSFTWNTGANTNSISVSPTSSTIYVVSGTAVNGCIGSSYYSQEVSDCTGLTENQEPFATIAIYPNPNNGTFFISANIEMAFEIFNDVGQKVKEDHLTGDGPVLISDLPSGIYFITGKVKDRIIRQKIIVTRS